MKNATVFILSFVLTFSISNLFAQEYDFDKHTYKFIKASDYQNDPRLNYYDVGFYHPELEMTNTSVVISGNVKILLDLFDDYSEELVFELKSNMTVDSVKINGNLLTYSHNDDIIVINYVHSDNFSENYQVLAQIYYHGEPLDGLFNDSEYYESQLFSFTYSLTEPYYAKYWFPCKQVLADKADSSYFSIILNENLKAGSNGLLVNEVSVGKGKKRMDWHSSYPIAYYLISVAVGDYMDYSFNSEIEEYGENIFVQNFIPNNSAYLESMSWYMHQVNDMLDVLSHLWGLYPHHSEKYGHCIVPINGGMEHQTMTSLGDFSFRLVIHELAHSWFGNYVTCASWQDIWINEGFASYGEYLGEEFIQPEGYEQGWLEECQSLAKEALTGSVYVPFEELNSVNRIFNYRLSYRKGACLVHMLRYLVNNDDEFFAALREFLYQYGNSTATAEDLKLVLETETGINFDIFFSEWYYGQGYPIYEALWYQNGTVLNIELTQTTTATATPLFTIPIEFKIIYDDASFEIVRKNVDVNYSNYILNVAGLVTDVVVNPDLSVLANVSSVQSVDNHRISNVYKIYPNPSDKFQLTILSELDKDIEFSLLDMSGQIIFSGNYSGYKIVPDLTDVKTGVYLIKINDGEIIFTDKLVLL
ncbi:MAG: M1 family aminopeptidase [Bacteroidales bacterium]|nr:M1 family aminopeptidase [Bacteroidales bacterium]